MSGQVVSGGRVRGLRETMIELRQADPVLYKKARTGMRKAVAPLVDDARKRIPNVPTGTRSNGKPAWGAWAKAPWDAGAARKGVAAKISLKKENKKGQINLLVVVQKSAAGAVFDMAGKTGAHTKGAQGAAFNRALSNRGGRASRSMWPAANSKMSEIDAAVKETIRLMEHDLNQALKRVY